MVLTIWNSWKRLSRGAACRKQEAALEGYLEGEMDGPVRERVEAHLAQCPRCAEALAEARESAALLRAGIAPAGEPGDGFTRGVMAGIAREESRREEERVRWHPLEVFVTRLALCGAFALAIVLSASIWPGAGQHPQPSRAQAFDLMPEPAHVSAASNDVLMAAIAENHGR
jgi:anti-sigma factor RsiW